MPSTDRPCDHCAHFLRCKHEQLACRAFTAWVEHGCTDDERRDPNRQAFVELFGFDDPSERWRVQRERETRQRRAAKLEALRQEARRAAFERRRLVASGLAQPLTKAERRKRFLKRRRLRWKIDPSLRERHLRLKREDAIRRGRRRGAAPAGSEGNRRHRIEAQKRRREVERERDGRTMSGAEFKHMRLELGLSIATIAKHARVTMSAAKQWRRNGPPAAVERWLRAMVHERHKLPTPPRSFSAQAAPAASGSIEARSL